MVKVFEMAIAFASKTSIRLFFRFFLLLAFLFLHITPLKAFPLQLL